MPLPLLAFLVPTLVGAGAAKLTEILMRDDSGDDSGGGKPPSQATKASPR
jgi:hypothetical protein